MGLGGSAGLRKSNDSSMAALCRPNPEGLHLSTLLGNTTAGFEDASLSVCLSVCLPQKMQELPPRAFFGGCEEYHICISGVFFACREAELVMYGAIYWALTMCSETKHQACSISFYLHRNHISYIILSSLYRRRSTANELVNFSVVSLEQWFSKWWSFARGEVKYFKKYPRLCSTPRDAYALALGYSLGIWSFKSSLGDSNVQPTLRTTALRQVVEEVGFEHRFLIAEPVTLTANL